MQEGPFRLDSQIGCRMVYPCNKRVGLQVIDTGHEGNGTLGYSRQKIHGIQDLRHMGCQTQPLQAR